LAEEEVEEVEEVDQEVVIVEEEGVRFIVQEDQER